MNRRVGAWSLAKVAAQEPAAPSPAHGWRLLAGSRWPDNTMQLRWSVDPDCRNERALASGEVRVVIVDATLPDGIVVSVHPTRQVAVGLASTWSTLLTKGVAVVVESEHPAVSRGEVLWGSVPVGMCCVGLFEPEWDGIRAGAFSMRRGDSRTGVRRVGVDAVASPWLQRMGLDKVELAVHEALRGSWHNARPLADRTGAVGQVRGVWLDKR